MQPVTERRRHRRRRTPHAHAHAKHFLASPRFPDTSPPTSPTTHSPQSFALVARAHTCLRCTLVCKYLHIQLRNTLTAGVTSGTLPLTGKTGGNGGSSQKKEKKSYCYLTNKVLSLQLCSVSDPAKEWASTVKTIADVLFLYTFVMVSIDQILSALYSRSDRKEYVSIKI